MDPIEFMRTLAEELNVKRFTIQTSIEVDNEPIEIAYMEGRLDLRKGGIPMGKPELAAKLAKEYIKHLPR